LILLLFDVYGKVPLNLDRVVHLHYVLNDDFRNNRISHYLFQGDESGARENEVANVRHSHDLMSKCAGKQ